MGRFAVLFVGTAKSDVCFHLNDGWTHSLALRILDCIEQSLRIFTINRLRMPAIGFVALVDVFRPCQIRPTLDTD
ncbi:hypothetical protein BMS3Bbin04_01806 [bacterium BMS3Bbin04]|nr:hypothetical protein BMS3Bbin04_01806 [bacterium BMS3Bbin04]